MRNARTVIAATLLILATAAGAVAQQQENQDRSSGFGMMGMDPDDWGMMPMMMQMRGMAGAPNEMPMMGMGRHVEGSLAFLKTELKITPAQEALWDAFAEAVRANAQKMADVSPWRGGARGGGMMHRGALAAQGAMPSLPDRLDWQEKFLTVRLDALRAIKKALVPLYAQLSDEQKQTADQLVHGPMMMGMMM